METTRESGGLLILNKSLETAGPIDFLKDSGPYTMFAPTVGAFERLPIRVIVELKEYPETPRTALRYHIVPDRSTFEELVPKHFLSTLDEEEPVVVESVYRSPINDSKIITPGISNARTASRI